jgi:hypothetical protein
MSTFIFQSAVIVATCPFNFRHVLSPGCIVTLAPSVSCTAFELVFDVPVDELTSAVEVTESSVNGSFRPSEMDTLLEVPWVTVVWLESVWDHE